MKQKTKIIATTEITSEGENSGLQSQAFYRNTPVANKGGDALSKSPLEVDCWPPVLRLSFIIRREKNGKARRQYSTLGRRN